MDSFADSTANGKLEGGDFIFPWEFEKNLVLESYSLSAADKTINLNFDVVVVGGGIRLKLYSKIRTSHLSALYP